MRKRILVSVDAGETRVAMLESKAAGRGGGDNFADFLLAPRFALPTTFPMPIARKKVIAGNWKMNKTATEAVTLTKDIIMEIGRETSPGSARERILAEAEQDLIAEATR